jgi:hypothetical protein
MTTDMQKNFLQKEHNLKNVYSQNGDQSRCHYYGMG